MKGIIVASTLSIVLLLLYLLSNAGRGRNIQLENLVIYNNTNITVRNLKELTFDRLHEKP